MSGPGSIALMVDSRQQGEPLLVISSALLRLGIVVFTYQGPLQGLARVGVFALRTSNRLVDSELVLLVGSRRVTRLPIASNVRYRFSMEPPFVLRLVRRRPSRTPAAHTFS